jgi:Phosphatidylinositol 3- and 4-kinase/Ubiquitin family
MSSSGLTLSPVAMDPSRSSIGSGCYGPNCYPPESILIFLTIPGAPTIPLRVLESESIASVKLRIQKYKGPVVKNQKLIFDGRELAHKNSPVGDYGVSNGDFLHLVISVSDLRAITVKTFSGKEFKFQVERNRSIGYIKHQILRQFEGLNDVENHKLAIDGEELDDDKLVTDVCTSVEAVMHLLVRKSVKVLTKPVERDFELTAVVPEEVKSKPALFEPILVNPNIKLPLVVSDMVQATFDGLKNGNKPVLSSEGTGGAYFMKDSSGHGYVAIFKPMDEEPMADNNPRGLPISKDGEGLKKGTRVGEGALREVAAYLLDHPSGDQIGIGFAGVPPTTLVRCSNMGFSSGGMSKIGSLQMFVKNSGSCEDIGPSLFPVEEVHKIAVLDMRLANADRHAGNILMVRKEGDEAGYGLVPIDHGYCLPESVSTANWILFSFGKFTHYIY